MEEEEGNLSTRRKNKVIGITRNARKKRSMICVEGCRGGEGCSCT